MSPRLSPPKKLATEEKEESPPPREAYVPRGMKGGKTSSPRDMRSSSLIMNGFRG